MQTVMDTIHGHRSIRSYKPNPVPDDLLQTILEAGIRASSSGNMQTYSIIVRSCIETTSHFHHVLHGDAARGLII